ncbi:IS3 family transposase [Peribacillus frigoritolerans]|uniref:IS3 family transposase n=1 Tax=Peribacillus frigoritolerans TaxID=450367 RepID=UPI003D2864C2
MFKEFFCIATRGTSTLPNNTITYLKNIKCKPRKGSCWDNACMENFFSHLKSECFYMNSFGTSEQGRGAVCMYIRFYNHHRFQKKLNNLSPYQYRTQVA